jgi:hypothetical protein
MASLRTWATKIVAPLRRAVRHRRRRTAKRARAGNAQAITVATRHYHSVDPRTGIEYEVRDRLVRMPGNSLRLYRAGASPRDPQVDESMSLADAFAWLRDRPEQIERAVFVAPIRYIRLRSIARRSPKSAFHTTT